jgi:hypothetical protein
MSIPKIVLISMVVLLRIAELIECLLPAQLLTPPAPGEWSARDVLAHLRACSDVWGKYIGIILSKDRATFRAVSPGSWINKTDYLEQEFHPSLQATVSVP